MIFVQADPGIAQPIDNLDSLASTYTYLRLSGYPITDCYIGLAEVHQVVLALRKIFISFVNNNSAAENAKYDFDSLGFCRKRILNASKKPWDSSIKTSRVEKYKFIFATVATAKCIVLADSASFLYNAGRQSLRYIRATLMLMTLY